MALGPPRGAEPEVGKTDAPPDEEGGDPGEVDNVLVGLSGTRGDVHHAQRTAEVGEDDGRDGYAAAVGPAQEAGGFAVLAHEQ